MRGVHDIFPPKYLMMGWLWYTRCTWARNLCERGGPRVVFKDLYNDAKSVPFCGWNTPGVLGLYVDPLIFASAGFFVPIKNSLTVMRWKGKRVEIERLSGGKLLSRIQQSWETNRTIPYVRPFAKGYWGWDSFYGILKQRGQGTSRHAAWKLSIDSGEVFRCPRYPFLPCN